MHARKRKNSKAELNTLPTILSHPFLSSLLFGLSFYPIAQSTAFSYDKETHVGYDGVC